MDQKPIKAFIISNEAWYCQRPETKLPKDEVLIGQYYENGGCKGEFSVRWNDIAPRLEVYQDAWITLSEMPEIIEILSRLNENEITPKDLTNALTEIGYEDRTERINKKERYNDW